MRGFVASLVAVILPAAANGAGPTPAISFAREVVPVLQTYCYDCHGGGKAKGGLALDKYRDTATVLADRKTWEQVLHHVRSREMPPEDADAQPTDAQRELVGSWLEQELYHFDARHPDPGRVVMRRLNRAEYNATIRDLVGVDFQPAAGFPADDSGYGFDNVADVLSLPPVLMEKYLAAAEKILDQAIVTEPIKSEVRHVPASVSEIGFNALGDRGDGWVHLISLEEDDIAVPLTVPAGDYLVRILAYATRDGGARIGHGNEKPIVFKEDPGPTKIGIMLDDTFTQEFTVTPDEAHPDVYEARIGVPAGRHYFRAVMRRKRGGSENELFMLNGRIGRQQPGIVFVKWMEIEGPLPAATRRTSAAQLAVGGDGRFTAMGERVLEHNGDVTMDLSLPREAEVILRAQAYAQQAGAEPARMEFRVDGQPMKTFDVSAPATLQPLAGQRPFSPVLLVPQPFVYELKTKLPAGEHRFTAAYVNDFADPANRNPNLRDRNLIVRSLESATLGEAVLPPSPPAPIAQLFAAALIREKSPPTGNLATARAILTPFARRAWRRPVLPAEMDRLQQLYEIARQQGDSFEAGIKLAMKAVLVSPHFLFIGQTPPPSTPSTEPRLLDEFALATRLSYFLWSSMPDDELLGLAENGRLRANLPLQVRRMLASPKARALVDNFAGQWLQFRNLETFQPDKALFPNYDPALRAAMQRETELFFEYVLREDRSVMDFLTGDFTFVNARLAKLYGLRGLFGEEFQKISLVDTPRRGVLTQASVLTLTSNPTRTSPVKRGKWILENFLGAPPPPPPPAVPALAADSHPLTGTLRQEMEQHRANPACASCHERMDPIGFGLENFNAIGAWRNQEAGVTIDASGRLGTGDGFAGAVELAQLLAQKKRGNFLHCLAEKMLTYALGRGPEYYDRPALDGIVNALEQNQTRFSALVVAIAESFPFQMRRGETPVALNH